MKIIAIVQIWMYYLWIGFHVIRKLNQRRYRFLGCHQKVFPRFLYSHPGRTTNQYGEISTKLPSSVAAVRWVVALDGNSAFMSWRICASLGFGEQFWNPIDAISFIGVISCCINYGYSYGNKKKCQRYIITNSVCSRLVRSMRADQYIYVLLNWNNAKL